MFDTVDGRTIHVEDLVDALKKVPSEPHHRPLIYFATPTQFASDAFVDYVLGIQGCTTVWKQEPIPV